MYDKTSLGIIKQIYLKPSIHKRELAKQLNIGMPSIDYSLKKIDKLIKKKSSGNQINYFLDYSKEALVPVLGLVEYSRIKDLPAKIRIAIKEFIQELEQKPLIAIIFGSYASGDYTEISDIDILLIFQKIENQKEVENKARKISMRTSTKINPIYLDYNVFKKSFHDSTKQFFKNLKRDKIVFIGINLWVELKNEEA